MIINYFFISSIQILSQDYQNSFTLYQTKSKLLSQKELHQICSFQKEESIVYISIANKFELEKS
jgi:hypothetical protein